MLNPQLGGYRLRSASSAEIKTTQLSVCMPRHVSPFERCLLVMMPRAAPEWDYILRL